LVSQTHESIGFGTNLERRPSLTHRAISGLRCLCRLWTVGHDTLHIGLTVGIDDRDVRHHIEALLLVAGSSSSDNYVVRSHVDTVDDADADAVNDRDAELVVAEDDAEDS
jgi:hypothetical protein